MWLLLMVCFGVMGFALGQPMGPSGPDLQRPSGPTPPPTEYHFNNQYMALMPKIMRPGQMFDVSITHIDPPTDGTAVTVNVALHTPNDESKLVVEKNDALPIASCDSPGMCPVTKVVSLMLPENLDEHEYNVTVSGMSGSTPFFNSTLVQVKRKVFSIFVQTDRAMYKPSQTIKFRVLTVDSELKPVKTPLNISIHDMNDNRLKQWINVESSSGVISKDFMLSDQPPLGDWYINVVGKYAGQKKSFEVAEYVLPKYEVTLDLPSFLLTSDEMLMATVTAKYTYGEPVRGKCALEVYLSAYYYEKDKKTMNITQSLENGKADFKITMKQLEDLVPPPYSRHDDSSPRERMLYRDWIFLATCKEELTGKEFTKDGTVPVKSNKFVLTWMPNTADSFKPGLIYSAYVQLKLVDGSPPSVKDLTFPGNNSRIQMKLYDRTYGNPSNMPVVGAVDINDDGTAVFHIKADDKIDSLNIMAKFSDGTNTATASKYVRKFKTRGDGALQIRLMDPDNLLKAGQQAEFNVTTATSSSIINFQVLAKGELVQSEAVVFPSGTSHIYKMLIDDSLVQQLAPKARIVAWYMTEKQEIISDTVDFRVDGAFQNNVSLTFNIDKTKPGSDVEVTVKAEASSFIGVLAVDQSSLLLASGNDITRDMVIDELETYDSTNDAGDNYFGVPVIPFRAKRSIWCPWCFISTGGKDSDEVFKNSGMIYLTDIYLFIEPPRQYFPWSRGERGPARPLPQGALAGPRMPEGPVSGPSGPLGSPASSSPDKSGLKDVTRVRTQFPETWLWADTQTGSDGSVHIKTKAPDTITSWVATAFALHSNKGLGIMDKPSKITVFKPFFVSLDLPYSVIRGEEVELRIIIFNYLADSLSVSLKLKKSLEFAVQEPNGIEFTHANVETTIVVNANDGQTISLWIKPVVLGNMAIEVEARSVAAADAVRRMLLVEPEGAPRTYDMNFLVEVSDGDLFLKSDTLTLPSEEEGLVDGSVRIQATAIGDIMGPAMNNLNNLVKIPYGCGEQNMLNFAPNIFVMNYLKAAGKSEPDLERKAVEYMERGYQRELTYQRTDGSFSAFGNSDQSGSTWLTAFVVKSFYQASRYIDVDLNNVARSVNWMLEQQMPSGQFNEPGRVIHTDMQGGAASDLTMTAYVAISLLEMKDMAELEKSRVSSAINKSIEYLKNVMKSQKVTDDPYVMAVITYAFSLNNDGDIEKTFRQLKDLAVSEDGMTYWKKHSPTPYVPEKEDDVIIWKPPRPTATSSAIESTAYAMLSYMTLGEVSDAIPIMRWLVSQRNSFGGYGSTQDTVMALQALAAFGSKASGEGDLNMDIRIQTGAGMFNFPKITPDNSMVLQKQEIGMAGFSDEVIVRASGQGMALVQISVDYNLIKTSDSQDIDLEVVSRINKDDTISIDLCATYTPKESSGMVVLEASMLSGYEPTNLEQLKQDMKSLKRVEHSGKTYYFYLDELKTGQLTCMTVTAAQVNKVAKLQKAKVKAYSYYAPHQMKTDFYLPRELAFVPVCDPSTENCDSSNGVEFEFSDKQDTPKQIVTIYRGHQPRPQPVSAASSWIPVTATIIMGAALLLFRLF